MPPYTIMGTPTDRVLIIPNNQLMRWRFYEVKDSAKTRIKFKLAGSKAIAAVHGKIEVYKKPATTQFHFEYLKQNGLSLYRGLGSIDDSQLVDNMLEYVETI